MASKRGPLSKAETFYVIEHAKLGTDISEIATDLDRPIKSIEKCYTKAQADNKGNFTVGDQFARHKGSVVMTENASSMSDETKKINTPSRTQNCVTSVKR